jgi:ureidoacrylate peracid hydrolase
MPHADIPQLIVDRVAARRGDGPLFGDLDPRRTALLVVDMQNAFLRPEFGPTYVPAAVQVVPNVNRLAAAVRDGGGVVYWIHHTVTDEGLATWSNHLRFLGLEEGGEAARSSFFRRGARGNQTFGGMDRRPEDETVDKTRFSPFVQGSSDLHDRLQAAGIDTLVVVGAVSNVCCESTVRDAMMLDYRCIMVGDANAARSEQEHTAALVNVYSAFGDVMTTEELVRLLAERQA